MLKIRFLKPEIRIVGWDDAPFDKKDREVRIFGAIFRGGTWFDGLLSTTITVDGDDSTEKITAMINKTRHMNQLRIIMLDGITFGGFNVVDIAELNEKTGKAVIAISRRKPNFRNIKKALENVDNGAGKWALIKKAGRPIRCRVKNRDIYYQASGINRKDAENVIKLSSTRSLIPEPLRVAHIIASGVVKGESYGRA
ncbi:MAG: DUF99 family protein [Candidatus Aenigmatarchaeota archaeon]